VTSIESCPPSKRRVARILGATGAIRVAQLAERRRPALRIVNCHSVPDRSAAAFADLIGTLARSWTFASPADLPALVDGGPDRPTLLVCFDDGLMNTVRNGAPALEAVGGRAIFAVPSAWPDLQPERREAWFREHVYPVPTELHAHDGDVEPASWGDLRALIARGHDVWSHGVDHLRLVPGMPRERLEREIVKSKERLEQALESPVRGYCPPVSSAVPAEAQRLIEETYEFAFSGPPRPIRGNAPPHELGRTNFEASWPQSAVTMQLSLIGDALTRVRGLGT
jgi:peptidoglycan/xylan/chitin deacetylase (PgdA/CDA1 family)